MRDRSTDLRAGSAVLAECPQHKEARTQPWQQGATLAGKLRDFKEDLLQTANFTSTTKQMSEDNAGKPKKEKDYKSFIVCKP